MGLSFDNILHVFTDNWVISLLIHSSCSVWMQPAREIHFPASCTYEKSWGKTPHALRASRREPCVVPQWLQPGDAGVRPPVQLPGAQHISETMDTASQMLYLGPSTLSLGLTCASSRVGKQAAGACYCQKLFGSSCHEDRFRVCIMEVIQSHQSALTGKYISPSHCKVKLSVYTCASFLKECHLTMKQPTNEYCSFFVMR